MARLKDVSFNFFKQDRKFICRQASQLRNSNPFWGSQSFLWLYLFICVFPVFVIPLCFSFLSPPRFLYTTQRPLRSGGGCTHPGFVWGGLLIQARCRHPAPSVSTRYLIKPGIPGGFEKPAGRERALSPHLILKSAVIIPRLGGGGRIAFLPSPILEQEHSVTSLLCQ